MNVTRPFNCTAYRPRPAEIEDAYRFSTSARHRPERVQIDPPRGKPQEATHRPRAEEPTRYNHDERNDAKRYRGHVAEVDAVRGLVPAFETFTRLVSVGQPAGGDLPYPPYERPKSPDGPARQPQDHRAHFRYELPASGRPEHQPTRDDLRILETVLVGSPVTSTRRPEVRPFRAPGQSHFRVLEGAVIQGHRAQSELPSTKLRPPSEPEGSYVPIPLNGRDQIKWQANPAPAQDRPSLQSYLNSFPQAKQNGAPYSHYAPLDSPFTRPSQRPHDGRNGRLIPSPDTITDNPKILDYTPTEQPAQLEYVRYESADYPRDLSLRRPKELPLYRDPSQKFVTDLKSDYSFKVNYKPRESLPETSADNWPGYHAKGHTFQDPAALTYEDDKLDYLPKRDHKPYVEHKPEYTYRDPFESNSPLAESYAAQKQKHLQESFQAKEPFPEAFAEPAPEYLQAVAYESNDPLRDITTTTTTPESQSALQEGAAVKGVPGVDYPVYTVIPPDLSFKCEYVEATGYYADLETRCQVRHIHLGNRKIL